MQHSKFLHQRVSHQLGLTLQGGLDVSCFETTRRQNKGFSLGCQCSNWSYTGPGSCSLTDILEITEQSMNDQMPQIQAGLPWHLLRKVMGLHGVARSMSLGNGRSASVGTSVDGDDLVISDDVFSLVERDRSDSSHPLDVLCAVLHSSDSSLQQELISKTAMCQFALPLLLPPLDIHQTLLLRTMRGIVKRWSLHPLPESRGFKESWVCMSMLTISFMQMGRCSFSKAKLLNTVLSPSQHHQNFFVHQEMEFGDAFEVIADGMVEISWYFPHGKEKSSLFPEPLPVIKLHGPSDHTWHSFAFSTVFIVIENTGETECVYRHIQHFQRRGTTESMAEVARDLKVLVDDDCEKHKTGSKLATEITSGIAHMGKEKLSQLNVQYKQENELSGNNPKLRNMLNKDILENSLGVEHFMWELGKFYEAECSMAQEREMSEDQRQLVQLPDIAADLMLEGFLMGLVDGEASNIPLQWVADVLAQLHTKLGGNFRLVVLAVLGMQSTRNSTLLNTVFGLQFPLQQPEQLEGQRWLHKSI
ncbi:LOW QUALITY PROTEIN: up-regulator of cell proliferation-like [Spheniscus humboldti]